MKLKQLKFAAALAITTFFLSCSSDNGDGGDNGNNNPPTPEVKVEVTLATSGTLGSYLVDKEGRSLYFSQQILKDNLLVREDAKLFGLHFMLII